MNNFFTQLQHIARSIRLSHNEKQSMRVQLYTYLEQHPVQASAPTAPARKVPGMYHWFSPQYSVSFAAVLFVVITGGTAFAAKGALPGDVLYPVKINVNERVATALATSPEEKAQVNAALATTRLEEAETLASNGKLNAKATEELAANFTAHAQAAQENTDSLQSNNPGTAAQLGTNFDSTLAAHDAILSQIGDDSSNDETVQNSRSLASEVRKESRRGNRNDEGGSTAFAVAADVATTSAPAVTPEAPQKGSRVRTFAAAMPQAGIATGSASTTAPAETFGKRGKGKNSNNPQEIITSVNAADDAQIAASLQSEASSSLLAVQADLSSLGDSLDPNTSAQVDSQLQNLESMYLSASASLVSGDTSGAKTAFGNIVHISVRLDAYLKAGKKFNQKLLSGLLNNSNTRDGGNDSGNMQRNHGGDTGDGN